MSELCTRCGVVLTDNNWSKSRKTNRQHVCKACAAAATAKWHKRNPEKCKASVAKWRKKHPEKCKDSNTRSRRKRGGMSIAENKTCGAYLGCHIAEQVLQKVFKNVEVLPYGHVGYDFVCNHGKRIDVKSSTMHISEKQAPSWHFNIRLNEVADYFLCLAFDNREDLNPLYIWLIPGNIVNHKTGTIISTTTINKWKKYKLDINNIIRCCNATKQTARIDRQNSNTDVIFI